MELSHSSLQQEVLRLYHSKVSTPEICQRLGLNAETVVALITNALSGVSSSGRKQPEKQEKHSVGRPRKELAKEELESLLELLCHPASDFGYHSPLWTPQQVIKSARVELGLALKKDFVWASLRRWGVSFDEQLRLCLDGRGIPAECTELLKKKRGVLYVVADYQIKPFGIVALVGLTPSKKTPLACAIQRRHRVMTDFVQYFLRGLLTLHPKRHLAVLMKQKSAYRTEKLKQLESQYRRLHLYESD